MVACGLAQGINPDELIHLPRSETGPSFQAELHESSRLILVSSKVSSLDFSVGESYDKRQIWMRGS